MNAIWAVVARLVTMVTSFGSGVVISRLVIGEAGVDSFALYSLVAALPALVPFADMGTGAVLVNSLARESDPVENRTVRAELRTVLRIMTIFAGGLMLLNLILLVTGGWRVVLGAAHVDGADVAVFACISIFALSIPLGIWSRLLLGMRRNHIVILIQGAQPVIALLIIWCICRVENQNNSLLLIVAPYVALTAVALIGSLVADRSVSGLLRGAALEVAHPVSHPGVRVMNVGWPMLVQALTPPITTQLGRFILAQTTTAYALAQYGLLNQVVTPLIGLVSAAGMTLWPYYSRARERGHRSLNPLILVGVFGFASTIAVGVWLLVADPMFAIMSDEKIRVPASLIACFGAQVLVQALVYPLGMSIMSPAGIRFQLLPAVLVAVSTVIGIVLLAPTWGIVAAPLVSAAAVLAFQVLPFSVYVARERRARPIGPNE
ncbi:hypothetical protein O1W71_11930 [Microbacterium sp. H37-C3]|uniref:lipopolysaccharide biosynthesis protein n=1 Tax=Microbacterium sp. H37-C3 TaxID=3004354 RepID=UPI0022AF01D7|nr:hypothetical protein [Microbacterium sp. H37-C3]MCZ4068379.1 hypothetical protein [Microbacterium sp. H37-C3]